MAPFSCNKNVELLFTKKNEALFNGKGGKQENIMEKRKQAKIGRSAETTTLAAGYCLI